MKDSPWALIHRSGRSQNVAVSGTFIANNRGLLYQLALASRGVVECARSWAEADLQAGRLVQVLPDWQPPTAHAYAITTTRLLPAKVRGFLDYLVSQMATSSR
jgi:DNA-binding transcriptional LysR family regulator